MRLNYPTERRRGRDPGQGGQPPQRAAGRRAGPGDRVAHRRPHRAHVPRLLQRPCSRRRSPTTCCAWSSPSCRPCPAWPRRGSSATRPLPCASGWTRGAWPRSASPRRTWPTCCAPTTICPASARRAANTSPSICRHHRRRRGGFPQPGGALQRRHPGAPG